MSFSLFFLAKTDVFVLSGDIFNAKARIEDWDISTWLSKPREGQTISRTEAKQTLSQLVLASQAGDFRGARISSLSTNACSTENNIPFRSLANHIVPSKFWKVDLDRSRVTR